MSSLTGNSAVSSSALARPYLVLMISSLICRAFKSIVNDEKLYPTEFIFDMKNMLVYRQTEEK